MFRTPEQQDYEMPAEEGKQQQASAQVLQNPDTEIVSDQNPKSNPVVENDDEFVPPKARLAAVTRKGNEIHNLLNSNSKNSLLIGRLLEEYKEKIDTLFTECHDQIKSEKQFVPFRKWSDEKYSVMSSLIITAEKYLSELTGAKPKLTFNTASNSVKSNITRSSLHSNTSSARVKLVERKAKLKAEEAWRERLSELQLTQLKNDQAMERARMERMKLETDILEDELDKLERVTSELNKTGERIQDRYNKQTEELSMKDECQKINTDENKKYHRNQTSLYESEIAVPNYLMSTRRNTNINPTHNNDSMQLFELLQTQADISAKIANHQEKAELPKKEISMFDGSDVTSYNDFIQTFTRIIENKCSDPSERLYYLKQFTSNTPHEIVKSCCHRDADRAYTEALKLLNEEYGNEHRTASAFLAKLDNWQPIKSEDGKALRDLSIFLLSCQSNMENMTILNQLNSPKEIMNVVKKLPYELRKKWRDRTQALMDNDNIIRFSTLVEFLRKQVRLINQPIFGDIKDEGKLLQPKFASRGKSLSTKLENDPVHITIPDSYTPNNVNVNSNTKYYCQYCKKNNHSLDYCNFFKKLVYDKKVEFVKISGLCFSCLKTGHSSKGCMQRQTCSICNKRHPSVLHGRAFQPDDVKAEGGNIQNEAAGEHSRADKDKMSLASQQNSGENKGAGTSKLLCAVIPIKIKVTGKNNFVETYAALDTCSTSSFINEKLLKSLGVQGKTDNISLSTMRSNNSNLNTKILNNLELYDLDEHLHDVIPVAFAQKSWPFTSDDSPKNWDELPEHLSSIPVRLIDSDIEVIIGMDRFEMLKPLQMVDGPEHPVYATLHRLGWAISGPVGTGIKNHMSNRIRISNLDELENNIKDMYDTDFKDSHIIHKEMSRDDKEWERIMVSSLKKDEDNHYEINLPIKPSVELPDNKQQISRMFQSLLKKLKSNQKLFNDYEAFMSMMIKCGFMEKVPAEEINQENCWYLSHHAVYHRLKQKIRIVFNCALKYNGVSLNDALYQGPDLTNNLLGVLLRFRREQIAFMGDIQKMFYQVKVSPQCRDHLRLFWIENSDLSGKPCEYRLTVHLFGANSSPSVSSFALQQTVRDTNEASEEAKTAVMRNFYVDDLLCSVRDEETACNLITEVTALVADGGFRLTEFVSNSREVLNKLEEIGLSSNIKQKNLTDATDRALGLIWNIEEDTLGYKICSEQNNITKRGVLSIIHKVYDPLGLAGPAIITAKKIFQDSCKLQIDWDEDLPTDLKNRWNKFMSELYLLDDYVIKRCVKPENCRLVQLHYFSDGSNIAYGSVAYIRYVTADNEVTCSPVLAKARLTPLNNSTYRTIPRIEMNGAKLSVILTQILHQELDMEVDAEYYWTDSTTVLKYLRNDSKRYTRFITNRISFILSSTDKHQWRHVPTSENPADCISRGVSVSKFVTLDSWKYGPPFLMESEDKWPSDENIYEPPDSELELCKPKKCVVVKINELHPISKIAEQTSNFYRLKRKIAWILRLKSLLCKKTKNSTTNLTLHELNEAEIVLYKYLQHKHFGDTIECIEGKKLLTKNNFMKKLDPFIDENGILRVGGRLKNSKLDNLTMHPIILPKDNEIVFSLIVEKHKYLGHMGRETLSASLRTKYWIVGINSMIRKIMNDCVICRKENGKPFQQKMSALPEDRVTANETPFTRTGIDFFGPFEVTNGRKKEKRYGVIFSCLNTRAIHLEMAYSLSTDSFINSFRRFISRRGNVKIVRSDNGTNLTSGEKELKAEISNWNESKIENWMVQHAIEWKFQPPAASHFGGVFEREIRSIKKVLRSMLREQPMKLSDEQFNTLLCEVENILNCRPLTELSQRIDDYEALTPNHLLLFHSGVTFPPGLFSKDDKYANRKWKQLQYLSNLFWYRWRREYLPLLQERQKWFFHNYVYKPGDLVMLTDQLLPRNQWSLGRVIEVYPGDDGIVRVVKVRVSKLKRSNNTGGVTELMRPVCKIILIKSFD